MWIEQYATNLIFLIESKILGKFITPETKSIIKSKSAELREIAADVRRARKTKAKTKTWTFTMPMQHPISFIVNRDQFQVDISGSITGINDNISEVNSLLRVWSLNENICYREGIDGELVKELFDETKRRVIVRFHFDRRGTKAMNPEPIYHLQVGGVAGAQENCWFPNLKVPRLQFPPMDIILLSELVLVNFFHEDSRYIREKPEWKSLVIKSQNAFQDIYFRDFNSYLNTDVDTVLGRLIAIP